MYPRVYVQLADQNATLDGFLQNKATVYPVRENYLTFSRQLIAR
jgi:hypothetical protein